MKTTKHSRTPSRILSKTNSKTKKQCSDFRHVNSKSTYEELIEALNQCSLAKDWELTHGIEDDILHKFLKELISNKYKTKKEIITTARMIYENTLKKNYPKWYS